MIRKLVTSVFLLCWALVLPSFAEEKLDQTSLVGSIFAQEEARLALMGVDSAFNDRAQEIGFGPAFGEYAMEDATYLPDGFQPVLGRENITAALSGPGNWTIVWSPENAYISASMDLGVTWGRYVYKGEGADGAPLEAHGKYTTVWRKDPAGAWKVVLDTGNTNPKPE